MIKASEHIERDLYNYLKDSPLVGALTGKIYRGMTRPEGSQLEDVVVKFLTGFDEQFQSGILNVNIYVSDIAVKGLKRKVADTSRLESLTELLTGYIDGNYDTEYGWRIAETPVVLDADEVGQHFVNARVRYERFTERY